MLESYRQFLQEKLITVPRRQGQVIFLAGGGGSGKTFALKHFIDSKDFKVISIDDLKDTLLKAAKVAGSAFEKFKNIDQKNPGDAHKLHSYVKATGLHDDLEDTFLNHINKHELPNLIIDSILKTDKELTQGIVPKLLEMGYQKKDIHICWVLTNYHLAVYQNSTRDRVIPEDILLAGHTQAAGTMWEFVHGRYPKNVDGNIWIILNNADMTVFNTDSKGKVMNGKNGTKVSVKDFTYLQLKKAGRPMDNEPEVMHKLYSWLLPNIPASKGTEHIHDTIRKVLTPQKKA